MTKIEICLGSSCYCRGNSELLETIERFLKETMIEDKVDFLGTSCEGHCANGPTLKVDNKRFFEVDQGVLVDLLNQIANKNK